MANGVVKWFSKSKGYGFIVPDDGGGDVFVHVSAVEQSGMETLRDGEKITFELAEDRKGKMSASNIKLAG